MIMKSAVVYTQFIAECPYCSEANYVDKPTMLDSEPEQWICEHCGRNFCYFHPDNQFGFG